MSQKRRSYRTHTTMVIIIPRFHIDFLIWPIFPNNNKTENILQKLFLAHDVLLQSVKALTTHIMHNTTISNLER